MSYRNRVLTEQNNALHAEWVEKKEEKKAKGKTAKGKGKKVETPPAGEQTAPPVLPQEVATSGDEEE